MFRAAALRVFKLLQHQHAGAFPHDEAVASRSHGSDARCGSRARGERSSAQSANPERRDRRSEPTAMKPSASPIWIHRHASPTPNRRGRAGGDVWRSRSLESELIRTSALMFEIISNHDRRDCGRGPFAVRLHAGRERARQADALTSITPKNAPGRNGGAARHLHSLWEAAPANCVKRSHLRIPSCS